MCAWIAGGVLTSKATVSSRARNGTGEPRGLYARLPARLGNATAFRKDRGKACRNHCARGSRSRLTSPRAKATAWQAEREIKSDYEIRKSFDRRGAHRLTLKSQSATRFGRRSPATAFVWPRDFSARSRGADRFEVKRGDGLRDAAMERNGFYHGIALDAPNRYDVGIHRAAVGGRRRRPARRVQLKQSSTVWK